MASDKKSLILEIKRYVVNKGLDAPSVTVYEAVIRNEVQSVDDFVKRL